ncbi:8-oxoguanine DNA glycosylase OGG fold protein [Chryseobacterium wangxinyae]|uniref:8-oxoguanine DNA glycosylase OGG fold protein n=1 Tax=Chryseobacterium sp. CY353 TaxID=2997334 RepID=UPI00226E2936|nr:hypothetical protein [Chryseobacterium sp. CY353]MCY0968466.1 hypothetical protein [Chryseobacterium sp. CY353]
MEIKDFANLIEHLPTEVNSFRIHKKNWKVEAQCNIVEKIFGVEEYIQISRKEIRSEVNNINLFIIKTLMWGYPTKGRGKNIDNLLTDESFEKLSKLLLKYKAIGNIQFDVLVNDFKNNKIKGLGISTLSKFLYFLEIKVEDNPCVILDDRLINIINNSNFEDIYSLKGIKREYTLKSRKSQISYLDFLQSLNEIAEKLNVKSEKIEMFLFFFGKNLY